MELDEAKLERDHWRVQLNLEKLSSKQFDEMYNAELTGRIEAENKLKELLND